MDLKAVMMHTYNVSKSDIPTLIILEDAESTIPWGNSDVLNYLDGINQPRTIKGCYMIMTTNFPQRIEPRVLKRPGRIDKIIKFGVLDQVNSIMCARHYFEGILFDSNTDTSSTIEEMLKQVYEKIIAVDNETGMTGAQIKNLSEATISYAISNKTEKISVDTIIAVRDQLSKDLKDVYEMADDESMSANKPSPIGFDTSDGKRKNQWEESLDWDSIINPEKNKGNSLGF
jgi:SpoVK/Ycf46/Vps4 family AAA+-type ATPase